MEEAKLEIVHILREFMADKGIEVEFEVLPYADLEKGTAGAYFCGKELKMYIFLQELYESYEEFKEIGIIMKTTFKEFSLMVFSHEYGHSHFR